MESNVYKSTCSIRECPKVNYYAEQPMNANPGRLWSVLVAVKLEQPVRERERRLNSEINVHAQLHD